MKTNFRKNTSFISLEDNLNRYFKEVAKFKMLTPAEERAAALAHDYNKLVCANMRYAITVARTYDHMGNLLDLIQCANVGLMKAAMKYDPEKSENIRFISYCEWYVHAELMAFGRKENTTYSRDEFFLAKRIATATERFRAEYGETPSAEELAEILGVSAEKIEDVMFGNYEMVSMDTPLSDEGEFTQEDRISGDLDADVYTCFSDKKLAVASAISKVLGKKEQLVVNLYWGLNGDLPMSVEDIAFEMDLTTQRVNQLKKSALKKLSDVADLREML